ncbi:uncharacterized protein LOC135076274 [Ostrinia nubilalis]|uniref:uncharacterized protein LOC135076274 n=1 Tax=Ostrinia nubilalis TaxID=29057 RepID=UPI00308227D1
MLMDLEAYETDDESTYSFTNVQNERSSGEQAKVKESDLGDYLDPDLTLACQTKKADPFCVRSRPASSKKVDNEQKAIDAINCSQCKDSAEQLYHVNYDTILKLKESTRKLLCVLEEIQSKTHAKNFNPNDAFNLSKLLKPIPQSNELPSVTDVIGANAIKKLEAQAKTLDSIYIQEEEDDCSIYKRLTRKCHCMNQHEYNDFIIHFNEDTKYRTSMAGEIIKNLRILKKFLYMNGGYTKNALLFLNEGLSDCSHTEKVEITQGCAHADLCNVFDEHSIVVNYISWPCKNDYYGDAVTQALTAGFLYKLAQLEEGRRYLNFSSKVSNDIKKVIRKKSAFIEFETVESLNATLNLLNPPLSQNINVTYYCKPIDEGVGKKTVHTLVQYRQFMTLDEVFTHLELLHNMSNRESGKFELMSFLPTLLLLFKRLLLEFDNSEMNILVTNILNNVVSKNVVKEKDSDSPKTLIIADTATEPIQMKTQTSQIPIKKGNTRKTNKSKLCLGITPHKFRNPSKRKVSERQSAHPEPPSVSNFDASGLLSRSRKFSRDVRSSVIVVPIEEKIELL